MTTKETASHIESPPLVAEQAEARFDAGKWAPETWHLRIRSGR